MFPNPLLMSFPFTMRLPHHSKPGTSQQWQYGLAPDCMLFPNVKTFPSPFKSRLQEIVFSALRGREGNMPHETSSRAFTPPGYSLSRWSGDFEFCACGRRDAVAPGLESSALRPLDCGP